LHISIEKIFFPTPCKDTKKEPPPFDEGSPPINTNTDLKKINTKIILF